MMVEHLKQNQRKKLNDQNFCIAISVKWSLLSGKSEKITVSCQNSSIMNKSKGKNCYTIICNFIHIFLLLVLCIKSLNLIFLFLVTWRDETKSNRFTVGAQIKLMKSIKWPKKIKNNIFTISLVKYVCNRLKPNFHFISKNIIYFYELKT